MSSGAVRSSQGKLGEADKQKKKEKRKIEQAREEEGCPWVGDFSKVLREKKSCKEKELE